MPRWLKSFFRKEGVVQTLTWLASLYMRFVFNTTRWTLVNFDLPQAHLSQSKGFITCFWHEKLFMGVFGWRFKTPFSMIISEHKDGRLIAETVKRFGIQWIAGSSTRGGTQAVRHALRKLRNSEVVGITPDGPRGPRRKVQAGTIVIAQLAQVDILPFSYHVSNHIIFNTWDRFMLPLPFGRGVLAWGDPVSVQNTPLEEAQETLEKALRKVEEEVSTKVNIG